VEATCAYTRAAGEELEIGLTSPSELKHIPPPGPTRARESAQRSGGLSHVGALGGEHGGERWVSHQGGCSASGSDPCGTNDPGHPVSPAPLSRLAVFIPKCAWLPSLRDRGLQGVTGPGQFLWALVVSRAGQTAQGR